MNELRLLIRRSPIRGIALALEFALDDALEALFPRLALWKAERQLRRAGFFDLRRRP